MPAHDGDAEHVWKDGDSWRGAGGDDAIVDALTCDDFGDPEDRGGVSGTHGVASGNLAEAVFLKLTYTF